MLSRWTTDLQKVKADATMDILESKLVSVLWYEGLSLESASLQGPIIISTYPPYRAVACDVTNVAQSLPCGKRGLQAYALDA